VKLVNVAAESKTLKLQILHTH